jgi:hypothetical protein
MTLILVASKVMVGLPPLADFMVMGTFVGASGGSVAAAGFSAHFLVGLVDGVIFAAVVASVSKLRLTGWGKSAALGLAFGLVVYLLVFLPISLAGFAPIMMAMMGAGAAGMMPMVQGVAVFEHLVFGLIVGASVFAGTRRGTAVVSARPTSQQATSSLQQSFKCQACGMTFSSKTELMEHSKEVHPIPAR